MASDKFSDSSDKYKVHRQSIIKGSNIKTGFPVGFLEVCMSISKKTGRTFSIRDGNPPIPGGQFKPMSIKPKTSTTAVVPLMSARKIPIEKAQLIAGSDLLKDEYYNDISKQSHNKGSLRFLLGDPNTEIIDLDNNGRLTYRVKEVIAEDAMDAQAAADLVYCIELSEGGIKPSWTPEQIEMLKNAADSNLDNVSAKGTPLENWHDEKWGEFDLDAEYYTYIKNSNDIEFRPEMVAGNPPYTGDADMFAVGIPINELGPALQKRCMITRPGDIDVLYEQLNEMVSYNKEYENIERDIHQIKKLAIDDTEQLVNYRRPANILDEGLLSVKDIVYEVGNMAEFRQKCVLTGLANNNEFIVGYLINKEADSSMIGDFVKNMIQHGPETNNPGKPSSLDDTILHFYNGEMYRTHNEDELVAFYMQPGYLEDNFQVIHPKWDMEKWAPVVHRQLELGRKKHMKPEVFQAYMNFALENNLPKLNFASKELKREFTASLQVDYLRSMSGENTNNIITEYANQEGYSLRYRTASSKVVQLMKELGYTEDAQRHEDQRKIKGDTLKENPDIEEDKEDSFKPEINR